MRKSPRFLNDEIRIRQAKSHFTFPLVNANVAALFHFFSRSRSARARVANQKFLAQTFFIRPDKIKAGGETISNKCGFVTCGFSRVVHSSLCVCKFNAHRVVRQKDRTIGRAPKVESGHAGNAFNGFGEARWRRKLR